ncbi:hypothetical protein RND81_06G154100 [Saponaria officinalis]|uniref:ENT domain-containing protein n=1 Tax=Saponaria officinalis TaxID=3572 RepID=A0AAW1KBY0_SAPOF
MRFKKGTKVEVLTLDDGPSNSWRLAEIIGSNNHRYTVRYEGCIELFEKATIERVSRKVIRPCAPPVDLLQDWVKGDVVEVLHNFSWKTATILKVTRRDYVLVKLFGSGFVCRVSKYDVRARLCWRDGEWIVIKKDSSTCKDMRFRIPSSRNDSNHERKKIRLGNKDGLCCNPKRVEKCIINPLLSELNGCSETFMKEKTNGTVGYTHSINLPSYDDVSITSSVASCSVFRNSSDKLHRVFAKVQYEDNDSQSSDAESFCQLRTEELLIDEIHRLELRAYRCTIGVLFQSGPLSWEQELLLTNLRDSLHISNDEHLAEIKNLVSSSSCIPTN